MTSRVPELGEDCTDNNSSFGGSLLATIDEFLDRMKVMAEELLHLKTTLNSPSNSQSKPLVKQVRHIKSDLATNHESKQWAGELIVVLPPALI